MILAVTAAILGLITLCLILYGRSPDAPDGLLSAELPKMALVLLAVLAVAAYRYWPAGLPAAPADPPVTAPSAGARPAPSATAAPESLDDISRIYRQLDDDLVLILPTYRRLEQGRRPSPDQLAAERADLDRFLKRWHNTEPPAALKHLVTLSVTLAEEMALLTRAEARVAGAGQWSPDLLTRAKPAIETFGDAMAAEARRIRSLYPIPARVRQARGSGGGDARGPEIKVQP